MTGSCCENCRYFVGKTVEKTEKWNLITSYYPFTYKETEGICLLHGWAVGEGMMMLCPDHEEKKEENQVDVNRVTLVGRIGKDPEIRYTSSGIAVANFSLATNTNRTKKGNEWVDGPPDWHKVVAWGKLADLCADFNKGDLVYVEGKIHTRSYEDKEGKKRYVTEVQAKNIIARFSGEPANESNVSAEDDVPF